MEKEKKLKYENVDWKRGLGRMKRWYACQEFAKYLYDSSTSDVEVNLLVQQAATGMFNKKS